MFLKVFYNNIYKQLEMLYGLYRFLMVFCFY
jgi:hypothetical protein